MSAVQTGSLNGCAKIQWPRPAAPGVLTPGAQAAAGRMVAREVQAGEHDRVGAVEQPVPAVTGPEPVRGPVAAGIPVPEYPAVQPVPTPRSICAYIWSPVTSR
jgi:hypothetical protein